MDDSDTGLKDVEGFDEETDENIGELVAQNLDKPVEASSSGPSTASGVIIGESGKKPKKRGSRNKKSQPVNSSKCQKFAPNYFVSVPINNVAIRDHIRTVQQTIALHKPLLESAFVGLGTLHLTLMVMHLSDESDINRAKAALDELRSSLLNSSFACPILHVSGVGDFNKSVVFAKLVADSGLEQLNLIADAVVKVFARHDIVSTDQRGFQPHITIMKLSKDPSLRKKDIRMVDPKLYADHVAEHMGQEIVESLQLCAMDLPKDELTGYYHILHQVELKC